MNIRLRIAEVNNILRGDFSAHCNNISWITNSFPSPIPNNKYEYLRHDAPFYCNSSLRVMLNYYQNKTDFSKFIEQSSSQLLETKFNNESLNVIIKWIISHTIRPIVNEGSDMLDLQNVGWWMGQAVYIACIVSDTYRAQYEKLFFEAWKIYFTNDTIDNY